MATTVPALSCPKCSAPLAAAALNTDRPERCPACKTRALTMVFPAMFRPLDEGRSGDVVLSDIDASCFYHAEKRAEAVCGRCGRFLCGLCDMPLRDEHLCPGCLETGVREGSDLGLETERTLYDSIALSLVILPILFWPITILTAPAALWVSFRYWKAPGSITPRTKIRFILAIVFALLQISGWAFLGFSLYQGFA